MHRNESLTWHLLQAQRRQSFHLKSNKEANNFYFRLISDFTQWTEKLEYRPAKEDESVVSMSPINKVAQHKHDKKERRTGRSCRKLDLPYPPPKYVGTFIVCSVVFCIIHS